MSEELPTYVQENYSKAVKLDLGTWISKNPLPALCESKYDGIRVFLFKSGEKLVLSSKHGGIYTPKGSPQVFSRVPEFLHAPNRMILDGEYVAREAKGLFLFDVLQVDDRDIRQKPLRERKKVLHEILRGTGLEVPATMARTAEKIMVLRDEAVNEGREGIVVKNPESGYGQPNSWLKLKKFDTVDCFVIGFVETAEMARTGVARSWSVGVHDENGNVVEIGNVGSMVERVDPRKVKKGSVIEVRFQEVTKDRKLRAPFILRIRHDKTPEECLLSQLT
jgi:bifunctional non-homologous end joining protein LigD